MSRSSRAEAREMARELAARDERRKQAPRACALLARLEDAVYTQGVQSVALEARLVAVEYLADHGFGRIAKRLSSSGVIDVVSTAAPGIDEIGVLGKIKQLERSRQWDAIIVDGPAAGHAVTMMTSASGLQDAVSGGPVRAHADGVLDMLRDRKRLQVALVTVPETTPVNATIETAFTLEDRVGVRLAPIVVNGVDVDPAAPDTRLADLLPGIEVDEDDREVLAAAAAFRDERRDVQRGAIRQLASSLPLGQVHIPLATTARLFHRAVGELADAATFISVRYRSRR